MPNFSAKYSSEYLTASQMESALTALPDVLLALFGECRFTALYGNGAELHPDLLWIPMGVETYGMHWFIEESINQQIIVPGESDLNLRSPEGELELHFHHEGYIRVDGDCVDKMRQFMDAAPYHQIRWWTQAELNAKYPDR